MAENDGRFPSYDSQWRAAYKPLFAAYQAGKRTNASYYADALQPKQELVDFISSSFFKADNITCSDSIMVYDIGLFSNIFHNMNHYLSIRFRNRIWWDAVLSGGRPQFAR